MKRLDASKEAIVNLSWSQDGKWITYNSGPEIRLAEVETGEIRIVGQGTCPRITNDNRVIFEKDGEICAASAGNIKTLISKTDLVKDKAKGFPLPSPDNEILLFCVFNVFDRVSQSLNAYPYRHFIGHSGMMGQKARITTQQWYGGDMVWFPDASRFIHYEFDSTAGPQIRVAGRAGEVQGRMSGLYPSISPDNRQIAAKPRNGGSVVIYSSKGGWKDEEIAITVVKIPLDKAVRPSAAPAVWLDNRTLIVAEGDEVFRVDTKKEKAEPYKKAPPPTDRRTAAMVASPTREHIAVETAVEGGFELRVFEPN
jgi:hypothetical protein